MAIPPPEAGLVISYAYLWLREHEAGRKDRPSVIILNVRLAEDITKVVVLPITHSRPTNPDNAIEFPVRIARSIGLDALPSWIVISEANEFAWPGYDLRQSRADRFAYGFLPPRFFRQVAEGFLALRKSRRAKLISRD
ncbi:MAG: growth inhibitor PemK [Caulobacteraceae bacterium]|nr:growth inhibitor PemK [Caulobacter sp.]